MKEKGIWNRVKEGAFWVAEKSTFITVPVGIFLAGKALLAKEFFNAAVAGGLVGVDLLMYQYFKNRRKNQSHQTLASLKEARTPQNYEDNEIGRYRLEKASRMAKIEPIPLAA